jgi:hypothetical protein
MLHNMLPQASSRSCMLPIDRHQEAVAAPGPDRAPVEVHRKEDRAAQALCVSQTGAI